MAQEALWELIVQLLSLHRHEKLIVMKDIEGMITFTYYNDIEKAAEFYRETLGFEEAMNRNWVKIFKVGKDSHIGLVNADKGYLKPQTEKPVMLSVFVEDVDAWYKMLEEKGLLVKEETVTHEYPHCWRCDTPLVYLADNTQWFLKMEGVRNKLVKQNDTVEWTPDWAGKGRFGDWVANAVYRAVNETSYSWIYGQTKT